MLKPKPKIDSRLVSFDEASLMLGGLHPTTIRARKGGTKNLTHVRGLGRRIFLIRAEVEALIEQAISQAQARERDRQKTIELVTNRRRSRRPASMAIAS
jgi:hypothetical protein